MPDPQTAHSNPTWARDELILALDLYFEHNPNSISARHASVRELSDILNRLPIHGDLSGFTKFRNPNGVYMKMCNFLRLDPTYKGKGLAKGSQGEEVVWSEFAGDRALLRRTADAIKAGLSHPDASPLVGATDEEEEFPEGKVLYRLHRARERNPRLRERAKAAAVAEGRGSPVRSADSTSRSGMARSEPASSSATTPFPCRTWELGHDEGQGRGAALLELPPNGSPEAPLVGSGPDSRTSGPLTTRQELVQKGVVSLSLGNGLPVGLERFDKDVIEAQASVHCVMLQGQIKPGWNPAAKCLVIHEF